MRSQKYSSFRGNKSSTQMKPKAQTLFPEVSSSSLPAGAPAAAAARSGASPMREVRNPLQLAMQQKKVEEDQRRAEEEKRLRTVMPVGEGIPPMELKRNMVINEIINTERDYLRDIRTLVESYRMPLEAVLERQQVQYLFSNVAILSHVNEELLQSLVAVTADPSSPLIGIAFEKMVPYLKMYANYCANQSTSRQTVNELLQTNPKFKEFLEKSGSSDAKLKDLLIKPVQRLCKYPLLLDQLRKNTNPDFVDYDRLERCFASIQDVVEQVNRQREDEEAREQIACVIAKLDGLDKFQIPLLSPGRKLLRELLVRFGRGTTEPGDELCRAFVFNDVIVLGTPAAPEGGASVGGRRRNTATLGGRHHTMEVRYIACHVGELASLNVASSHAGGGLDLPRVTLTDSKDGAVVFTVVFNSG
ncbi:MAG TPA: RhoGEF domain-containing protein, partial [archaeon]|nr:RhoGEF domain-containing protein [archaeon]